MIRLALLIAAATAAGCSLTRPEVADPANLPSPSYRTDDVQYYAPPPAESCETVGCKSCG